MSDKDNVTGQRGLNVQRVEFELSGEAFAVEVPPEQVGSCIGAARAIAATNPAIARQIERAQAKITALKSELRWRRPLAVGFKLGSLICAALLGLGVVPEAGARWVGLVIVLLSILDFVFANQKQLVHVLDELSGQNAIIDFAGGSEARMIAVFREVHERPRDVLDAYADYLLKVLEDMREGGVELRKRMEKRETELAARLRVPEPAVAQEGESEAVKNK